MVGSHCSGLTIQVSVYIQNAKMYEYYLCAYVWPDRHSLEMCHVS